MPRRYQEEVIRGAVLGLLEILEIFQHQGGGSVLVNCKGCGRKLEMRRSQIIYGAESCGCQPKRQRMSTRYPVEYGIWRGMIKRCTNPSATGYEYYGGRGIRVCDSWLNSFQAFIDDVGLRPDPSLTLDRIDNDGDYRPGNVRWATRKIQNNNQSTTRIIEFNGRRQSLSQWGDEFRIPWYRLSRRIKKLGINLALLVTEFEFEKRQSISEDDSIVDMISELDG